MNYCLDQEIPGKKKFRCAWLSKEDAALLEAITKYKEECWNLVGEYVGKFNLLSAQRKTVKQCREQWNNQLNPRISLGPLTGIEVGKLFRLHAKFGNSWSKISKRMNGRTDNTVKNYFMCRLRKLTKSVKRNLQVTKPKNEEDLLHTLYLLDYLYKYYISPERYENIQRTLTAQTIKRKNRGDRYINEVVIKDPSITAKLASYTKALISSSNFPIDKLKLTAYQYLTVLKTNNHTISFHGAVSDEDVKTLNLASSTLMFNKLAVSSIKEVIELPLPNWEKRSQNDDFIPTFTFSAYISGSVRKNGL